MYKFLYSASLILLLFFLVSKNSTAATFTVTDSTDCGPNTIVAAILLANSTPGKDTINFAPGIKTITFPNCRGSALDDSSDDYYLWISESVDIIAPIDVDPSLSGDQKLTINGEQVWIDNAGGVNTLNCPGSGFAFNARKPPGLLRIGTPYIDNSGIAVTVENIKATRMRTFSLVFKGAGLSVINSELTDNADNTQCINSLIRIRDDTKLIIDGTHITKNQHLSVARTWDFGGMILEAGDNSVVEINNSLFENNVGMGSIMTSGKLTVVSSLFHETGGIMSLLGDVTLVNSAFSSFSSDIYEGIYASGGKFYIEASTFNGLGYTSATPPTIGTPPDIEKASLLRFRNGTDITIDSTVIHTPFYALQTLPIVYVGPTSTLSVNQSYSSDGSLIGSISAPPVGINDNIPFAPWAITPLIGGPLIDQIANPLIDPISGNPIILDVFENPRVNGVSRDIGAVELYDAPVLSASGIDSAAVLLWSKPNAAGATINEYIINYRETGSPAWIAWTRHDTQLLEIVRHLTNGTSYDFRVAAKTNIGQLPWSNVATATPVGSTHLSTAHTSLSASTLHFGNIPVGNNSSQTLTITNSGNTNLGIKLITSDNTVFTVFNDNCSHQAVAPGNSCTLDIHFTPAMQGAVNGHILIPSNASTSLDKVGVSGIGDVASTFLSTAHLSFGNQIINTSSTSQAVTITNSGVAPLTITSLTSNSGEFVISNNNCVGIINIGNQCTFDVTFTPTHIHGRSSTISLISSAASSPDSIALDGNGVSAYALTANTGSIYFNNQQINTTSQAKQIILTNSGTSSLSFSGITIPTGFIVTQDNCTGQTIISGHSCTVLVAFTPNQLGFINGSLLISSNHPDNSHTILLYGTGVIIAQATPIPVNSILGLFILSIGMLLCSFYFIHYRTGVK